MKIFSKAKVHHLYSVTFKNLTTISQITPISDVYTFPVTVVQFDQFSDQNMYLSQFQLAKDKLQFPYHSGQAVTSKGHVSHLEFSASQVPLTCSGGKAGDPAARAHALHMWEPGFHARNKNESLKKFFSNFKHLGGAFQAKLFTDRDRIFFSQKHLF